MTTSCPRSACHRPFLSDLSGRIAHMFDTTGRTGQELAARLVANETDLRQRESEVLVLAAGWADVHDLDPTAPGYAPLVERAVGYGGDGCPDVSEYAVHELAALRGTSSGTAEQLVADALDLRHRHPHLWTRVRAGEVRAWQAVHVARTCHHLTREPPGWWTSRSRATWVSSRGPGWAGPRRGDPAGDPTTAAERAEQARRSRGVWAYPGEDGLKTLVAKAAAGDVVCLMATVNRLADVLAADRDTTSADERRAKALGLLAQPARVLELLIAHQDDEDVHDPSPSPPATTRTLRSTSRSAAVWTSGNQARGRAPPICCRGCCCISTSPTPPSRRATASSDPSTTDPRASTSSAPGSQRRAAGSRSDPCSIPPTSPRSTRTRPRC